MKNDKKTPPLFWQRRQWLLLIFVLSILILLWRAVYLQIMHKDFLQTQGEVRHLRTIPLMAHRGSLFDRNGELLAMSTPVESVWINPKQFITEKSRWKKLAILLQLTLSQLETKVQKRKNYEFVYIKRHIPPHLAQKVRDLNLSGVFLQREYRRYYPMAEMTSHVLGFTNIDDKGQEGLELALNQFLTGLSGEKQVIQDKYGQIIAELGSQQLPQSGQDIYLSLDRRLQYYAYRELKTAVKQHRAKSGSAVILDAKTGEVLAMVNQPAYNPNNRQQRQANHYRNRAVTDVFEPGSTAKPFTIAAALKTKHYLPYSKVNTSPGKLQLGKYTVKDSYNYGSISLRKILQKSSNVGASKVALSLNQSKYWSTLADFGFGHISNSGFPGEASGRLPHYAEWNKVLNATLSFGYGLNVTTLQLARAYAVFAHHGILPPVHFLSQQNKTVIDFHTKPQQIIAPHIAQQVLNMLETVVGEGGTGQAANIQGFRVAGKTGTARKFMQGKYSDSAYLSLFVGIAPVTQPRLVMAVIIDEPRGESYYGGEVAAPIFAKVMANALRLLNIAPDNL